MLRNTWLLVFICLCQVTGYCNGFDYNTRCQKAYKTVLALRLTEGQQLLDDEKREHPNNTAPYFLEDYIDFFRIYLSGNKNIKVELANRADSRLSRLRKSEANNPWYLYCQAEVLMHQAFAQVRFREYASALFNIRKAYKLLEQNSNSYPSFVPNNKSLGMLRAVLGIVPAKYQWGLSLLGMQGNLQQGMEQLKAAANTNFEFKAEAVAVYAMLLQHLESKPKDAWAVVQANNLVGDSSLFSRFIAADIAMYSKHNTDAINLLNNRPIDAAYTPVAHLDYLLGLAYLQQLDTKNAIKYLERFLQQTQSQDFKKAAYQKLAWAALINQQPLSYNAYMQKVKTNGINEADPDKQAQKEADNGMMPDSSLLKARLLFDGGYYQLALNALATKHDADYKSPAQQLELTYRKGRIYDEAGDDTLAMACYRMTIYKGKDQPYFYAANAALQLGYLYERHGDKANARDYYNQCLTLKSGEYESSLSAKAHAALDRLKK